MGKSRKFCDSEIYSSDERKVFEPIYQVFSKHGVTCMRGKLSLACDLIITITKAMIIRDALSKKKSKRQEKVKGYTTKQILAWNKRRERKK